MPIFRYYSVCTAVYALLLSIILYYAHCYASMSLGIAFFVFTILNLKYLDRKKHLSGNEIIQVIVGLGVWLGMFLFSEFSLSLIIVGLSIPFILSDTFRLRLKMFGKWVFLTIGLISLLVFESRAESVQSNVGSWISGLNTIFLLFILSSILAHHLIITEKMRSEFKALDLKYKCLTHDLMRKSKEIDDLETKMNQTRSALIDAMGKIKVITGIQHKMNKIFRENSINERLN